MNLTVAEILSLPHIEARNIERIEKKRIKNISTDSRTARQGDLFVALRGEKFDGHEFVTEILKKGALCAIVDRKFTPVPGCAVIVVDDTTKALGHIAGFYRRKYSIPVLAVAGSNGKTTIKEMIAAVLRRKYRVLSTKGNLNNHIGVPQTIFQLRNSHEIAVVETGTNHFGEVKYLCEILQPTHGLITNIGGEHLEFFGDIEGVAREEGELFNYLAKKGTAFVNADDGRVRRGAEKVKRKLTYGFSVQNSATKGTLLGVDSKGCFKFSARTKGKRTVTVQLKVPGRHVMENALAAVSVGMEFNVAAREVGTALEKFSAVAKRMEVFTIAGVKVLDDTYNANADSVISALRTLQSLKVTGRKIVVLGDMRELGTSSEGEHRKVGQAAGELGFDCLLTYGADSKFIDVEAGTDHKHHFAAQDELSQYLCELICPGDAVLVKGSRGMKMENVVAVLRKHLESTGRSRISSRPNRVD